MEEYQHHHHHHDFFLLPKPSNWFEKLLSFQVDLIYNSLASIFSPINTLFKLASKSYHNNNAHETKYNNESSVEQVPSPQRTTYGSTSLLKKLGLGFLSAVYVCMVLALVLIVASVLGVCLVRFWVEEPVVIKESLHFDYTDAHPSAVFLFDGGTGISSGHIKRNKISVPVGHRYDVSVALLMPESDFNRDLGVFQLSAELLSVNGSVITKSSQPCMLKFRSSPVRLARTVLMGVPLVLGFSGESQKINVQILRHKEDHRRRTNGIRVTLHPRAGTSSLPQIYEAEIVMNSHLPWPKEFIRNWKWTFYIWVSLCVYIMLLMFLLCFYRPLFFLVTPEYFSDDRVMSEVVMTREVHKEFLQAREGDESREVSELLNKWRRSRKKRKAMLGGHGSSDVVVNETIDSSASSISMSAKEDVTSMAVEDHDDDDVEDSESVCLS